MNPGHLLLAYHGCDATTRDDLVSGRLETLDHSQNEYDWLGPGNYFFESDAQRAMLFAQKSAERPEAQFTKRPIVTPAVVGAVLCVQSCLDMTTQPGLLEFSQVLEQFHATGVPLAINDDANPLLRRLNNQVFTALHAFRTRQKFPAYQMVRGAFMQGDELGKASGFTTDGHIQLAVRDAEVILSWFLPARDRLMTENEYAVAKAALQAAPTGAERKPRVRAR